jgi:hypothetical protein
MKNNKQGFVAPLIIGIIALLAIGGGTYIYVNKKPVETQIKKAEVAATTTAKIVATTTTKIVSPVVTPTEKKSAPVVGNTISTDNLWTVFDSLNEALKNKDVAAFNAVSYVQVPASQVEQFSQMASFLYAQDQKINKADFINKWQDDKQAIYFTNPIKADDSTSYSYTQAQISFVKDSGVWKVLMVSPSISWGVAKSGTSETASQVEKTLQAMIIDTDKDGLTDEDETCSGGSKYDSRCVKTDPNKRDTNGNGLWDGIEHDMK